MERTSCKGYRDIAFEQRSVEFTTAVRRVLASLLGVTAFLISLQYKIPKIPSSNAKKLPILGLLLNSQLSDSGL